MKMYSVKGGDVRAIMDICKKVISKNIKNENEISIKKVDIKDFLGVFN